MNGDEGAVSPFSSPSTTGLRSGNVGGAGKGRMRSFREIKDNYRFSHAHEQLLMELRAVMEEHADEVMSTLSLWIMGTKGAARFFTDETRQKHVFGAQRKG